MQKEAVGNKVREKFGKAATAYHQKAEVQQQVAGRLINSLKPWREILPAGPILELGCGTGFLSKQLTTVFPERRLIFSDISPRMVDGCRRHVGRSDHIDFRVMDATQVPTADPAYAMTISSFAAQWFPHPALTLARWLEATKPGGLLLAAFPGHRSFPEWRAHAEALGLPFTANQLPETEEMVVKLASDITQVDYYEDTITQRFESAADFFGHIKNIGAATQQKGRHLSSKEMRLLINYWDQQDGHGISVSWHIVFLAVKKRMIEDSE